MAKAKAPGGPVHRLPYQARNHRIMVNLNRRELVAWRKAAADGSYRSMAEFVRMIVNESINQKSLFE